jgi:sulfatase maturation enzyme AslB (radical SAM superfamily)
MRFLRSLRKTKIFLKVSKVRWWVKSKAIRSKRRVYRLGCCFKKIVRNWKETELAPAKARLIRFIPASDVKIMLEGIPENLRFRQRGGLFPTKPTFCWSPVKGAQEYEIAIKDLQSGKWQYLGHIKGTRFQLTQPLDEGRYLWKVRAGGNKYSKWALPAKFVIDDGGNSYELDLQFHKNIELKRRELTKHEIKLKSTPIQLAVILEGRGCNIACIYCSHKLQTKSKVKLHPKLVKDLAKYLPSVRTVSFGGSEPMIYPEFRQICDMAENYPEVQLSICTNGMLIDEYWAKRFCRGNFPWIRISVDGATSATYEAVRRGGNLEKILHGVKLINRYRQKKGIPKLQWNFVVTTLNFHEIVQFVELAHNYNIDAINLKMLIVEGDAPAVRPVEAKLVEERMKISPLESEQICLKILKLLTEAEFRAGRYGIHIIDHVRLYIFNRYPYLASLSYSSQGLTKQQVFIHAKISKFFCHMPFINLSFGDGRSHFCCYAKEEFLFIPYEDGCKKINEIWNSQKFQEARRLMYENPEEARRRICEPVCPYYHIGLRSPFLQ